MRKSLRQLVNDALETVAKHGQRGQVPLFHKFDHVLFRVTDPDPPQPRLVDAGRILDAARDAESFVTWFPCCVEFDRADEFLVVQIGYDDRMFAEAHKRGIRIRKTAGGQFEALVHIKR